jgi:hypothetical protein
MRAGRGPRTLIGSVALAWVCLSAPGAVSAASPQPAAPPSPEPVVGSGDSRSDGQGPGLVGSPVVIAAGVVVLGAITAAGTLVVLRLRGPRDG